MQILHEPRQVTEKEDVHLIRTFLISTKPNEAEWAASRSNINQKAKEWIGKDFVIIPEKIFDLSERQPGHVEDGSFEQEMEEIKRHSHGKIVKIYGPFNYDDGSDDVFYEAGVKLNNSKSASILLENGNKTWTKFAVSPSIRQWSGPDNNISDYTPMGLFLVIKGAYGEEAVIKKMCSGSELSCGKSLSAAILNLQNNDKDEYVSEVLSSFINTNDTSKHNMSTQQVEKLQPKEVKEVILEQPKIEQPKVETIKEEVKIEQPKGVTISEEEFASYKREREEHKQLVLENKTNKLNEIFNVVEDADIKKQLVQKYVDKDVNLLRQFHSDLVPHVEKFVKGKEVKEGEVEKKDTSKSSSIIKPEPQKVKDESQSASVVVPNNVNEVLELSRMFTGDII